MGSNVDLKTFQPLSNRSLLQNKLKMISFEKGWKNKKSYQKRYMVVEQMIREFLK